MSADFKSMPLVVIAGPTAVGKSGVAVDVCLRIGGQVVSADSMQVYKKLDIATAKISREQQKGVKHHLIDVVEPDIKFGVYDYVSLADKTIKQIIDDNDRAVICGGTGFYIDVLLNRSQYDDLILQNDLESVNAEYDESNGEILLEELKSSGSKHISKIHQNDKKRIVREVVRLRNVRKNRKSKYEAPDYSSIGVLIGTTDMRSLYKKIEERVDNMIETGLIDEAEYVYKNRHLFETAAYAIGYKEFFPL
ncbi:MAG: tRNA (adenosine(37)-N6)-dimethylallyltransferase MiaA, partial [Ruminococcaceae bacterium]|nr:tRNA (adenosine(37)-N6)-dimethylallyltransferase MiaA [Oscillospiraceae bacterium]